MNNECIRSDWTKVTEIELVYRSKIKTTERPKINSPAETATLLRAVWQSERIELLEEFKILLLNNSNRVLGMVEISRDGLTGTVADIKFILAAALLANATGVILSHNHPSGALLPSQQDVDLTRKIQFAARYHDITIVDHIIITAEGYYSFADRGIL